MMAGATSIGVGTANFVNPGCSVKIIDGLKKYCQRNNIANITELVGAVE
jgi:dihydroorotate dehydrogenase (NAD+) catalytic subunit